MGVKGHAWMHACLLVWCVLPLHACSVHVCALLALASPVCWQQCPCACSCATQAGPFGSGTEARLLQCPDGGCPGKGVSSSGFPCDFPRACSEVSFCFFGPFFLNVCVVLPIVSQSHIHRNVFMLKWSFHLVPYYHSVGSIVQHISARLRTKHMVPLPQRW